ncbi:phosphotransferase [Nocardioides sp. GXZ039]|uniref:phosphotransferase n=1 Tax=Nocardioides sp. GXZ039 TaxID=3136018 RepID=UPI0030F47BA7
MSQTQQLPTDQHALVGAAVERIWPDAAWDAEPIEDGMTNRNFKVTVRVAGDTPRVVVVQEQLAEDLAAAVGIRRSNQWRIWPEMTELGLAPALLGSFDDLGVTVVDFVDGDRAAEFADRDLVITLGARALRRLHDATRGDATPGLCSDPFEGIDWFASRVAAESPQFLEEFRWALDVVARIKSVRGPYEVCQVHTDPSQVNMFVAPERDRMILIDWEYVGAGDGYLDLGHFAARYEMSPAEEETLVRAYEGTPLGPVERGLALVRLNRFIAMLREGLWSALADGIDFLDFDHAAYARLSLDQMATTARRPDFEAAFDVLGDAAAG